MTGSHLERPYHWRRRQQLAHLGWVVSSLSLMYISGVSADSTPLHKTCNTDAQCLNGGKCLLTDTEAGSFLQCHCQDGYNGNRCEHFCPLPCMHGGVCHSTSRAGGDALSIGSEANRNYDPNDFVCKCLGYFTGDLCQTPYANCRDGSQCFNGGVCRERETHFIQSSFCSCPPDRDGPRCENLVAPKEAAKLDDADARLMNYKRSFSISAITAAVVTMGILVSFLRKRGRSYVPFHEDTSGGRVWLNVV